MQLFSPGDELILLETMKIQTTITAETVGVIEAVMVEIGDTLNVGDRLVKIDTGLQDE